MRVVIVGGGVGGIAAAIALLRRGLDVVVYERADEGREVGAGLQITPNATRLLDRAGVLEPLVELGIRTSAIESRSWKTGALIGRAELGDRTHRRFGAPTLHLHRADLVNALASCLPPDVLHLDSPCASVSPALDGAVATLTDGRLARGDVVVGADGIRSAVRDTVLGPIRPVFSDRIVFRGLVPAERAPELAASGVMTNWFGPGSHMVQSFAGPNYLNLALTVSGTWDTDAGWTGPIDPLEVLDHMAGWDPAVRRLVNLADHFIRWPLSDIDPLGSWTRGRVTLLGDAAHAMLPHMAQGAAQAIEDGFALAAALDRWHDDVDQALAQYESVRIARTRPIQERSRADVVSFHLPDGDGQAARDRQWARAGVGTNEPRVGGRAWIFEYDAEAPFAPGSGPGQATHGGIDAQHQ